MSEHMDHMSNIEVLAEETSVVDTFFPEHDKSVVGTAEQTEPLRCPLCRRAIFSASNGSLRLRTRMLVFENGSAITKCKHCRNDIQVPIIMFDLANEESLSVWDSQTHENGGEDNGVSQKI